MTPTLNIAVGFRVLGLANHIFDGVCQRIYGFCTGIMRGAS